MSKDKKEIGRQKRHRRVRRKLLGTPDRPRISIHRSLSNLYVQLVDDLNQKTLLSISTRNDAVKKSVKYGGNIQAAMVLGQVLAKQANSLGVTKAVFDRGGYLYHGRIKALAEGARKEGMVF